MVTSADKDVEQLKSSHTAGGSVSWYSWYTLVKLKIHVTEGLSSSTPRCTLLRNSQVFSRIQVQECSQHHCF